VTWKEFNSYLCVRPPQFASFFFLTILGLSPCGVQGSSHAPCASSSFGVGSAVLNINDTAATDDVDNAVELESVIPDDKSTDSTLSRSIGVEVSGYSNALRLG